MVSSSLCRIWLNESRQLFESGEFRFQSHSHRLNSIELNDEERDKDLILHRLEQFCHCDISPIPIDCNDRV